MRAGVLGASAREGAPNGDPVGDGKHQIVGQRRADRHDARRPSVAGDPGRYGDRTQVEQIAEVV
ncbi:MAG TPA: hypothetical protein VFP89_15860 [Propionibacteriaceae bacterium]|nr:hypothetical protein [Propionibacteriaceae bacterium]